MKKVKFFVKNMFNILLLTFLISPFLFAAESAKGIIQEMGRGKFILEDENGLKRKFHEQKKTTMYKPGTWRPANGDKVSLNFTQQKARWGGEMLLVVSKIELLTPSESTLIIKSPLKVEMLEIGKRFIQVNDIESGQAVKFEKNSKTQIIPAGWVPNAGEKAIIKFHSTPARFGFNLVYYADKVERIVEGNQEAKTEAEEAPENTENNEAVKEEVKPEDNQTESNEAEEEIKPSEDKPEAQEIKAEDKEDKKTEDAKI